MKKEGEMKPAKTDANGFGKQMLTNAKNFFYFVWIRFSTSIARVLVVASCMVIAFFFFFPQGNIRPCGGLGILLGAAMIAIAFWAIIGDFSHNNSGSP